MGEFASLAILVVVSAVILRPLGRPYASTVVMAGCTVLLLSGLQLLEPVLSSLLSRREAYGELGNWLDPVFSLTGTALLGDMAASLCRQAGEEELAQGCTWVAKIILIATVLPVLLELLDWLYASFSQY